ncbi:MAG: radical SAM protein [Pseudomonadota bacterium]|nr:radical SAM protein [Pseudomonadota bacterium]
MSLLFDTLDRVKAIEAPLRRWVLPDRFHRVEIETNSRCNRGCHYCPVAVDPRDAHEMSEALFCSILDQLAAMGFRGRLSPHFFGEPLVDPRLPKLMAEARRRLPGARIVIYTNGDALTPNKARALLDAGVSLFVVTFEGGESEAFQKTRAALPWWTMRRRFLVRHFTDDVKSPYNRGGSVLFGESELHMESCHAPSSTLVVDAWGKLKLCPNDYYGREDWGDLNETPLGELWDLPRFRRTRRQLLRGEFRKDICRTCVGKAKADRPLMDHGNG